MRRFELINADEALKTNEEIAVLTSGISMRPMLREHRDVVIIGRVSGRLKKNDVPLYRRAGSGKFVLHRILKVTEDGYVIRGDNLYRKEYDVKDSDIIGVLKAFYRDGKYYDCLHSRKYRLYVFFKPCKLSAALYLENTSPSRTRQNKKDFAWQKPREVI